MNDKPEYVYRVRTGPFVRTGTRARITAILTNRRRGHGGTVERARIGEWEDVTKDFAHLGYHYDDED